MRNRNVIGGRGSLFVGLLMACLLCGGVSAEMRTWTLKDGTVFEGEFVRFFFDKLVLKGADGEQVSYPRDSFQLSKEDQEYLELEDFPELKISIKKSITKKNFSMITGAENRPPEWRGNFGVKVIQAGSTDYPHELRLELFAIGKEIRGNRYLLLDRQRTQFHLDKTNGKRFEFDSKRTVRMTDLWDANDNYSRRGEQYFGFLIIIRDKRGKIMAVKASNDWLEDNMETLDKRSIGNYMDKTCMRTYPSRPESYIANRAAGRN